MLAVAMVTALKPAFHNSICSNCLGYRLKIVFNYYIMRHDAVAVLSMFDPSASVRAVFAAIVNCVYF